MMTNIFIPTALSLLSSYSLILTSIEYRHAYELLSHSHTPDAQQLRTQLEDALRHIAQELTTRGHCTPKRPEPAGAVAVGAAL